MIASLFGLNHSSPSEEKTMTVTTTNIHQTAPNLDSAATDREMVELPALDEKKDEETAEVEDDFDPNGKNIPDVTLGAVKDLPVVLAGMNFDDIRRALRFKYNLFVKDEPTFPDLYIISYEKRERQSSSPWQVTLDATQQAIVDQYRGVIVEKSTNKPLCYTFDRMNRHLPDEWDLKECEIMESCDGSQIKIFYYEKGGFWVVSTTRRIDASRSYFFSKKSFLELFQEAATVLDWSKLDKKCCYSFVLYHPENRVVMKHEASGLIHVLTRNMETMEILYNDNVGLPRAKTLKFQNRKEIWGTLKKFPYFREGYVIRHGSTFIKVVNRKYQDVKSLRGNTSSIIQHFFDLRRENKMADFLRYYSEHTQTFSDLEMAFQNLCMMTYNEYIMFRVRKAIESSQVTWFLKHALYTIHGEHLQTHVRIRLPDVQRIMAGMTSYSLRKMVEEASDLPYSYL